MTIPPPGSCFCCSNDSFQHCCEPLLSGQAAAATPLALMRSRYTAYVLGREDYLLATWAPATRPSSLSLNANPVRWLELVIHQAPPTDPDAAQGEVEFSTRFIEKDQLVELKERSRFILQHGRWYYLDGDTEFIRENLGRNSPCPCGSGRKYKRCCLNR